MSNLGLNDFHPKKVERKKAAYPERCPTGNQRRPFRIGNCIGPPPLKVICDAVSLYIGQLKTNTESIALDNINILFQGNSEVVSNTSIPEI